MAALILALVLGAWDVTPTSAASIIRVKTTGTSTWPCGDTWANACSLQTALLRADLSDEIWVAAGTYKPTTNLLDRGATFRLFQSYAVYGGFAGTETARDQRNWTTNVVTLSGDLNGDDVGFTNNGENSYHVVFSNSTAPATLDGVTISGGNANGSGDRSYGAGILDDSNGLVLANVILSGNSAAINGGGMHSATASPTLTDVTFSGNRATSGGGMYNGVGNDPTLTRVTFSGNSATSEGGGMYNDHTSNPTLTDVTFRDNSASSGGGIYNGANNLVLTNATFGGNSATAQGGGMNIRSSGPMLTNVTFSGNSAASGGGIYNWESSDPQVRNSIFWGNSGGQISNSSDSSATVSNSVVQGGYAGGTGILTADPLLGALGDYGGGTQTFPLLPGSSAIKATSSNCPTTDQRGVTRSTPTCDIGAFESRGFTLALAGGDNQTTRTGAAFAAPLALTVSSAYGEPVVGGRVTFTPPASGASATIAGNPAPVGAGGAVSAIATANSTVGSYTVAASAAGAAPQLLFHLQNIPAVLYAVPNGATSGGCASWGSACELRYALTAALAGYGQEIWVKAGTYKPTGGTDFMATFQLKNGVAIYGGFDGTESTRDARDPAANVVVLSGELGVGGGSDNSCHVVTGATGATLDGVTITAGHAIPGVTGSEKVCGEGGGMYNASSSPALNNVIFDNNSALLGGGMYNSGGSSPALTDVTFHNNWGNASGGGMYNDASNPTLTDVTFLNNDAGGAGGGMYNSHANNPTLTGVTFSGNSADSGGGMFNASSSSPTLTNVTFGGNSAINGGNGGGMYNSFYCNPTLTHVTFSGNSAGGSGGGMYNRYDSNPQVRNSILWGNSAADGTQIYNLASAPTVSNSVVQGGYPGGTGILTADPLLGALGDYGGGTQTLPLLPGSPAIDATGSNCPTTDQRGVTRSTPTCDMGAFESRGFTLALAGGDNQKARTGAAFAAPLALTVSSAHGEPVAGGRVTFTPPASGASATIAGNPAPVGAGGAVSAIATANSTVGSYTVAASAAGAAPQLLFHLQNIPAVLYAAPNGATSGGCASWGDACELRYALTAALAGYGQEIWVKAGTYKPANSRTSTFQLKNGVAIYGGFDGTESTRDARDPAANVVVLSGDIGTAGNNGDNSYHVVTGATGATLDGVTITAGNANGTLPHDYGGGMYNASSSPALANVTFSGNAATHRGGGMYNEAGNPALNNVTFSGNSAQLGGGMYNYASSPTLTGVTFDGNHATSGSGGGLFNDLGSPTLVGVTLNGNTAQSAGGMRNSFSNPTLTGVTFTGNQATLTNGGGLLNTSSNPVLTNVTFSGNSASSNGGGMYNDASSPQVRNSIFWGNTGGQIYNLNGSAPTVSDSVVQGGYPGGTDILTADPLLGSLGDYGGDTHTIPLLPGSPAIDAGNATYCTLGYDQRGVSYVSGGGGTPLCDIGAFESQGFTLGSLTGTPQSTLINTAFAIPLGLTVSSAHGEPVAGGKVTFTPPASGASAALSGGVVTVGAGGGASVSAMANDTPGAYHVTASAAGAADALFSLENSYTILYAKPGGATTGYCQSWTNSCELHHALGLAAAGQEIWVAAGTYKPTGGTDRTATFQLKNGVAIYGGFDGTETTRDQRDLGNLVILSGDIGVVDNNADNAYHVVTGAAGATLDGVTITRGNANGSDPYNKGGGIYNFNSSPTLANVTIVGNSSGGDGGGIYNWNSSPTLANVAIVGNSGGSGGGMSNNFYSSPTLTNVTFHGNSTSGYGGGMENYYYSSPTLTNVTFGGNSGFQGGGMYNDNHSSPPVRNSIFWGNTANAGAQIYNDDSDCVPTVSDSVVQGGYAGGSGILTADPLLGALGNYGGSQTLPLLPGSSAIDATTSNCPAMDQRGVARSSPACDVGAFESQGFVLGSLTGTPQSAAINTAFATPLGLTVTANDASEPVAGGRVTFTPPGSGASATIGGSPAAIGAGGTASAGATANGVVGGPYNVVASAAGAATSVNFSLTNRVPCSNAVTVANTGDDGAGSLRQAIADVCAGGTITFEPSLAGQTITLTSGQLAIAQDLGIDGQDRHLTISGNDAVRVFKVSNNADVTLANLTIVEGRDTSSECEAHSCGGGLKVDAGATVTLQHSMILSSSAYYGGGIFSYGALRILHSTIAGNVAESWDGGIYSNGSLVVENSTISGNTAGGNVGGLASVGNLTMSNSTIAGNTAAGDTGGLRQQGATASLYNNIIANNTGADCALAGGGTLAANVHNLIKDGSCSVDGVGLLSGDPMLGPLADNGGGTWTMALGADSPAIDAGDAATCAADPVNSLDQRGQLRDDLQCDVGAYELKYADSDTVIRPVATTLTTFGPALAGIARDGGYADPGVITVKKEAWSGHGPQAIDVTWDITPTVGSGFRLILQLCYSDAELGGLDEAALRFWRNDGTGWAQVGGAPTLSMVNGYHCAALSGVESLSTWTLATSEPTAVELAWFAATAGEGAVVLAWETASEVDLLGFYLHRAEAVDGPRTQLDEELLPGQAPGSPVGSGYEFVDEAVAPGVTYWYWLEAVDVRGAAALHGPVSAGVQGEAAYRVYLPLVSR